MAIDKRVSSIEEAIQDISDGSTILIAGFGGAGFANGAVRALARRGPKDLTLVVNAATHRLSYTHELIEAGLVSKIICSAARGAGKDLSAFEKQWQAGKIELQCLPQGTFAEAIRAGGAGIPAFFTPVGVGTDLTKDREVRVFNGREYVLEHAITGDFAIVRADTADRYGNLSFRFAQTNFAIAMATAAKTTIAEVRVAQSEALPLQQVQLPGIYVNRVVAA